MAKKKGSDGWWIAGLVAGGLALLYYLQTGVGKENDSALIPNTLEARIDALIASLNKRFDHRWVDLGVRVLKFQLQNALPPALVSLIDTVAFVENAAKRTPMTGYQKRQLAVQLA